MSWKMRSGVTKSTPYNLLIGPGVIYRDFVSPENPGTILGATKGGNKIKLEQKWHVAEIDGLLGPVKDGRWMTDFTVELDTNLIEITEQSLKIALPGAVISSFDTDYDVIQHNGELTPDSYFNIAIVGEITGKNKPVIFLIRNAIATDPLDLDLKNGKDDVVLAVKFQGTYDAENPTTPPYSIFYPKGLAFVEVPVSDVVSGSYVGEQLIHLSSATLGAAIHYTVDGTTPTTLSPLYTAPITVGATKTIKAIAVVGSTQSPVATFSYIIDVAGGVVAAPIANPVAGPYVGTRNVVLSTTSAGASIYYTVDGSTPTAASTLYAGPIVVAASETIKAIAILGADVSAVTSAAYVIS